MRKELTWLILVGAAIVATAEMALATPPEGLTSTTTAQGQFASFDVSNYFISDKGKLWRAGGYPFPLANTIGTFFDGGAAIKGNGTYLYPGSQAASTSVITMVDDTGSNIIELVNQGSSGYEGQHAIFFQTAGCAFTGGSAEK